MLHVKKSMHPLILTVSFSVIRILLPVHFHHLTARSRGTLVSQCPLTSPQAAVHLTPLSQSFPVSPFHLWALEIVSTSPSHFLSSWGFKTPTMLQLPEDTPLAQWESHSKEFSNNTFPCPESTCGKIRHLNLSKLKDNRPTIKKVPATRCHEWANEHSLAYGSMTWYTFSDLHLLFY